MNGNIEDYISHDRANTTSKRRHMAAIGLIERNTRGRIAAARRCRAPIVGLLTGGHYITDYPDEWCSFAEQKRHCAVTTFKRSTILNAEACGQMSVFNAMPTTGTTALKRTGAVLVGTDKR